MKTVTFDPTKWKLVPLEPDSAMIEAPFIGIIEDSSVQGQLRRRAAMACNYRAMIRKAPEHPADDAIVRDAMRYK